MIAAFAGTHIANHYYFKNLLHRITERNSEKVVYSWTSMPAIIPTRQIQIYGDVFEVVLQEKLSQIC